MWLLFSKGAQRARESLIYVRNLISRSLKHFPLSLTTHTQRHTHTHSHMCLVYFYVKRIKKSFLEFRRHKLIFIYDPRISKSSRHTMMKWEHFPLRQTHRYMGRRTPLPSLSHTPPGGTPACLVAKCITPLNYYSSLVNSFSDAAGEDLCCLTLRSSFSGWFACILGACNTLMGA